MFERLTKRMNSISYAMCGNVILSKCENCNSRMPSCHEEDCGVNVEALKRLAAYEDSGLSPEQVQEFAKAQADGRLVVLPVKVGDVVHVVSGCLFYRDKSPYTPCEVVVFKQGKQRGIMMHLRPLCEEAAGTRYHRWFPVTSIGLTVFLTREAAEKAISEVAGG